MCESKIEQNKGVISTQSELTSPPKRFHSVDSHTEIQLPGVMGGCVSIDSLSFAPRYSESRKELQRNTVGVNAGKVTRTRTDSTDEVISFSYCNGDPIELSRTRTETPVTEIAEVGERATKRSENAVRAAYNGGKIVGTIGARVAAQAGLRAIIPGASFVPGVSQVVNIGADKSHVGDGTGFVAGGATLLGLNVWNRFIRPTVGFLGGKRGHDPKFQPSVPTSADAKIIYGDPVETLEPQRLELEPLKDR